MSLKYKDIIKKFGKIALMGAVTLGAVGGTIASNYSRNTVSVSATESVNEYVIINDTKVTQYPIYIFNKDEAYGFGGTSTYSYNLVKTYNSFSDINNITYSGGRYDNDFAGAYSSYGWSYTNDYKTVTSWGNVTISKVIQDTTAPALETQVFMTNVDSPMTLEYILKNAKFVDEVDGDIPLTSDMVTEDNYSANKNKVGKYTIKLSASDKAGNVGTGTIEVWVLDKTAPVINGTSVFTSNMSSPLTLESILSHITVTDNVDSGLTPTVVSNGFTDHENEKGEKIITLKATDTAGNESAIFTIKVNVVDDIKPTITGTNSYTTSYKTAIELSTIEAALTTSDNIDTGLKLEKIADNYTGNKSIPGKYTISYRTTDTAGNISETFNVTIEVNDKIPPVFYTNGKFIGITQANALSHQELVNVLIYMEGLYENETAEVQLLSLGGYSVNQVNAPGVYSLSYKVRTAEGESEVKTANIKVLGEEEAKENDKETITEERTSKLKEWFSNAWNKIKTFFVNVGKWIVRYIGFGWAWDEEGKFIPDWSNK